MGLIKDIYSAGFFENFTSILNEVLPSFNKKKFLSLIFDEDFKNKEWKDRMKHTTVVLHTVLPKEFPAAIQVIEEIIATLRKEHYGEDNLAFMFLPDYIETYGLHDFKTSVKAFVMVTQFISCEFAVRPFLLQYGSKMTDEMVKWSLHKNAKVRRLASEGSRPRLPWAMAIPALKKDPAPLLPILENLKNDPSESVRRSVANNLNDIAKDHPDMVIALAAKWKGESKETDAIIKHGCRTLLKQGNPEILKQYGLVSNHINLANLKIATPQVRVGNSLEFSFSIQNDSKAAQTVRLEYGIYYQKSKGHLARKVYKISERIYQPEEEIHIARKQSFRLITTRTFHTGRHQLSIIVNGTEKAIMDFDLLS
jgi:3-methyladenine DNA glycosylase AlkC